MIMVGFRSPLSASSMKSSSRRLIPGGVGREQILGRPRARAFYQFAMFRW